MGLSFNAVVGSWALVVVARGHVPVAMPKPCVGENFRTSPLVRTFADARAVAHVCRTYAQTRLERPLAAALEPVAQRPW